MISSCEGFSLISGLIGATKEAKNILSLKNNIETKVDSLITGFAYPADYSFVL